MAIYSRHGFGPAQQGYFPGRVPLPTLQADRQALDVLAEGCVAWSRRCHV